MPRANTAANKATAAKKRTVKKQMKSKNNNVNWLRLQTIHIKQNIQR